MRGLTFPWNMPSPCTGQMLEEWCREDDQFFPHPPWLHEGGIKGNPPSGPPAAEASWTLLPHGPDPGPQALEPQTHLLCPAATRRRRATA
jgi:hypothetical protein